MSTPNSILIQSNGVVPVDPDFQPDERAREDLERQADCPELITFLKRTCDAVQAKDNELWERIVNEQVRNIAYFDNRQYGIARGGVFYDAKWEQGDIRPIDNRFFVQIQKLMMEMMRSQPKLEVKASDPNDSLKVEAAKFAQHRINEARKRMFKYSDRQRENQSLLLKTITWRYVSFNENAPDSPKVRRPRTEKKQYGQTRSILACKDCSAPMKPLPAADGAETSTDQYQCIGCGGTNQKTIQLGMRETEVVTGYDEVSGGQVESQHVDPMMVRIDLAARRNVSESSFLWYHQLVNRCILEEAHPNQRIMGVTGQEHTADRHQRDLQSAPSNAANPVLLSQDGNIDPQGGNQLEKCPYDLIWLDPVMYRRKKFPRPQRLWGGREIPANVELGQFFPEGMCVARNSDQVLNVYGENKNLKWMFCVYNIREWALHGAGVSNLIGPQDTRNEIKSYLIANLMYNAARREFIRDQGIVGNRLPALNEVAIVSGVPKDKPIRGYAYESVPGSPLPEQAVGLYESENGAMQEGAGTSSLDASGAAPDLKAMGTATGVNAMREQAVGRMGPNLMLSTEMEEEWGYTVLEHELRHYSRERFMKMANQAVTAAETDGSITFSADGIQAFMNSNPRHDFTITTVEGSWMPRTEMEQRANFAAFAQFAEAVAEKMQAAPALAQRLLAQAAETWGVDMDFSSWTPTALFAMARIKMYARTIEKMAKHGLTQPTAQNVQTAILYTPDAAVNDEMDDHLLYLEYYKEWWSSDEGRSCPPLLRAVITAVHKWHRKGLVAQAQQKAVDELAANEPREQKAAELAAAAAAQQGGGQKGPSVSMSYKDAPNDVRRQIEQSAGYQPSQEPPAPESDGTNEAIVKAQTAIAVQEHKHQLESQRDVQKAQLEVDKSAAQTQLDEERAAADHGREVEIERQRQQHEAGIEGAKMMHQSATQAANRIHEANQSDKDRKAKQNSTKK